MMTKYMFIVSIAFSITILLSYYNMHTFISLWFSNYYSLKIIKQIHVKFIISFGWNQLKRNQNTPICMPQFFIHQTQNSHEIVWEMKLSFTQITFNI